MHRSQVPRFLRERVASVEDDEGRFWIGAEERLKERWAGFDEWEVEVAEAGVELDWKGKCGYQFIILARSPVSTLTRLRVLPREYERPTEKSMVQNPMIQPKSLLLPSEILAGESAESFSEDRKGILVVDPRNDLQSAPIACYRFEADYLRIFAECFDSDVKVFNVGRIEGEDPWILFTYS
jgi:hypothetical protein